LVEQHGLFDPCQGREQLPDTHLHAGPVSLSDHEPCDRETKDAVEDVDPDLLLGPVEHRREGDDLGVLHLAEVALDGFL